MTGSRSGDDDYDAAAGSNLEQLVSASTAVTESLVSCGLSAAEIAERSRRAVAGGFSGDNDYDPAAGSIPELSEPAFSGGLGSLDTCVATVFGN
jgi:hypothetical protein